MTKFTLALAGLLAVLGTWLPGRALAQGNTSLPFTLNNNSTTADADLWVAIVGIDTNGNHVWINPTNSQVLPMSSSYNTVTGPTINGNTGPGGNSKYAACFFRLSTIPGKTFRLPYIAGCRVYVSRGQQLYFYFFGASGAPSGYAGPNLQNSTDPNQGIIFETIELTNNAGGFFGNTTRVDAFNYPMGLELSGSNGYYKRTGELLSAADIVSRYKANVPTEFQGTVNSSTGVITFPSKTAAFGDGTNGTPNGQYGQYFKSYIDAIWNKYKGTDLIFYAGNAGVFKGRVDGSDRLVMVGQSGAFAGRTGIINGRPSTQMAFEGKGLLDNRVGDGDCDLVVQAQMTAAINRHVVDVTTATPGQQNFYDASRYYQAAPMNYYARFWHLPGVSVDNLSYGFAYDDVNDQSATLQNPGPTKVVATWGGFVGQSAGTTYALPGKVEAENFAAQQGGVQTEATTDAGGGRNINDFTTNEWTDYSVSVGTAGTYKVDFRVASANGGATLQLRNGSGAVLGSINVGNTGGWQSWQTISTNVSLPAGKQTLRLFAAASTGCNVNWLNFTQAAAAYSVQLEAENNNYNQGMTAEPCSDTGGGQDMGYIDKGDFLTWFDVNFPSTGSYTIEYRVASGASGGSVSCDIDAGAYQLGTVGVPATGGWQTWTTVTQTVTVPVTGLHKFGIFAQSSNGGWNINWVRITKQSANRDLGPLAAAGAAADARLTCYPNPVTDRLHLDVAPELTGRPYRVLNAVGQALRTGTLGSGALDVSALPAGLYLLSVPAHDGEAGLTRRFTKE